MKISEDLFIERWYQLLRPEQGVFCCVLPESVCDTPTELDTRIYLLSHFKIKAIISLPYLTFKPYTSVKTCVIYAEKRSTEQVNRIEKEIKESGWRKKEGVEGLKKFLMIAVCWMKKYLWQNLKQLDINEERAYQI